MQKETKLYCDCVYSINKNEDLSKIAECFAIYDSLKNSYIKDEVYWEELNDKLQRCSREFIEE